MHPDDIVLWKDGFWCFAEELSSDFLRDDDYRVIPNLSEEWQAIAARRGPATSP